MTTAQIYQSLFASAEHPPKLTIVNESGTYELTQFRGNGPCSIPMLRIETDAQCQATDGQRASIQIEMDAREARELATVLIGFADANEATTEAIERGYLERGRERLGGFYVGQQTFTCSPSEQKHGGAK